MRIFLVLFVSVYGLFGAVDINHADIKSLTKLKGMGEVKASRVLEYKEQNGCFETIDELVKVKGIGLGFIEKNKQELQLTPCK